MATKTSAIILMILCTGLTSFAQVFYKKSASSLSLNFFSLITNYNLIIGLCLYAVGAVIMLYAFKNGEVTVLYPIIALSYIWVSILAVYFFGETMNIYRWIAIIFVFIGIVSIGIGGKDSETIKYEAIVE
jgi:uncharacterized membrane protein